MAPWAANLAALLPALAGLGLGRNPDGIVPALRSDWEPVGRNRIALAVLAVGLALAWGLRLAHVLNGWEFFGAALAVVLAARGYVALPAARRRTSRPSQPDIRRRSRPLAPEIPVEWWGVRRDWRPEDEEVLARGIAGG